MPEEEYTTIGGYVFGALGRLPIVGDHITAAGATFTVREMEGRRVATLGMELPEPAVTETGADAGQSTDDEHVE